MGFKVDVVDVLDDVLTLLEEAFLDIEEVLDTRKVVCELDVPVCVEVL